MISSFVLREEALSEGGNLPEQSVAKAKDSVPGKVERLRLLAGIYVGGVKATNTECTPAT